MASTTSAASTSRRNASVEKVGSSFRKQEEIGRGSFATVFRATHTDVSGIETVVAIKSVNMAKLNKKLKDNLTSEISILKSLHHPHIAALIDCKETTQHIHLIMEYVALGDLSQFIKRRETLKDNPYIGNMIEKYPNPRVGGLNEVVVRHFLKQLSSALQFLRKDNLIHRDLKPQNLLLNPSPQYFENVKPNPMPFQATSDALEPVVGVRSLPMLKIADFGFARALPTNSLAETLCGSPLYMAPEILRYEKYDAKADLWSVGTVLYEMVTAKPPFRAANHVELLRKIEKTNDVIKFGDEVVVSDPLKRLIRSLLKRDPRARLDFPDLFQDPTVLDPIPGLVDEDLLPEERRKAGTEDKTKQSRSEPLDVKQAERVRSPEGTNEDREDNRVQVDRRSSSASHRRLSSLQEAVNTPMTPMTSAQPVKAVRRESLEPLTGSPRGGRPPLIPHATAPGRQELVAQREVPIVSAAMVRQGSGGQSSSSPRQPSMLRQEVQHRVEQRAERNQLEQDRVAQDIAFERDYVLVEKRAVEVNALADELEANPRLSKHDMGSSPRGGAMTRRATTQAIPNGDSAAHRAVQMAQAKQAGPVHARQNSYNQRGSPSSTATGMLTRALSSASNRIFGMNVVPPINLLAGRSPPTHSPFPTYPGSNSSLILVGEKTPPADEDSKFIQTVEELATRSDVVYGFAEVKYTQITPVRPGQRGLHRFPDQGPISPTGNEPPVEDLTAEDLVTVSEEALVLYVKTLALLAKAMDTAARWLSLRKKAEAEHNLSMSPTRSRSPSIGSSSTAARMNNVVQWTRSRFNEVLEKTDLVRSRLVESQKQLPQDHPSHPSNIAASASVNAGIGSSSNQVLVSPGVTVEKLLYSRALEMSKVAAIDELANNDLMGCEISYITAIRMLEAILENDEEDPSSSKRSGTTSNRSSDKVNQVQVEALEAEERAAVTTLVKHVRGRLEALRKKLHAIQKRKSEPSVRSGSDKASPPTQMQHRASTPVMAAGQPQ